MARRDWLEDAIYRWMRGNMAEYMVPSDAKQLAKVVRSTPEFREMRQDHADLAHLLGLVESYRREREATTDGA